MRRILGVERAAPDLFSDPVFTVGVFDGVHRGHRAVLAELSAWARETGGEPCVLTFERHPRTVLRGEEVPALLGLEHRLLELERCGVAATVVADFAAIKDLQAADFLRDVLRARFGCRRLLLGFDSHIGKDRAGDASTLPGIGAREGVEVRVAAPVLDPSGGKIGSTAIRRAVQEGDLARAEEMLGRPFTVLGRVVRGAGRGRGLGTATANLDVGGDALPPDGIYLVRVRRGRESAAGVANLGTRPTFEAAGARLLEVHVPGWSGDLYGETLEVRFGRRLRPEIRFETAEELKRAIEDDLRRLAQAVAAGEI